MSYDIEIKLIFDCILIGVSKLCDSNTRDFQCSCHAIVINVFTNSPPFPLRFFYATDCQSYIKDGVYRVSEDSTEKAQFSSLTCL